MTDYTYDYLGRIESIEQDDNSGNSVAEKRIDFTYDGASGQYDTITYYKALAGNPGDVVMTATYTYDDAGRLTDLVYADATPTEIRSFSWTYNAAGRVVRTVQNYDDFDDYGVEEEDTECDITVEYEYDSSGRLVTMVAYNAKDTGGGVEAQATAYLYESDINASWQTDVIYPDSADGQNVSSLTQSSSTATATVTGHGFSTDDWVYIYGADQAEYNGRVQITVVNADTFTYSVDSSAATPATGTIRVYDADGADRVSTTYDRLGRTATTVDQRGVVHTYIYDSAGRLAHDCATSLGSSGIVDDGILRISTTYDDMGRVETVTSYDDPDVGEGSIVNQIQYEYDDWGNLYQEYEEHDGAVDQYTHQVMVCDGTTAGGRLMASLQVLRD